MNYETLCLHRSHKRQFEKQAGKHSDICCSWIWDFIQIDKREDLREQLIEGQSTEPSRSACDRITNDRCRGISFLTTAVVFHIVPTVVEIALVSGILVRRMVAAFVRANR